MQCPQCQHENPAGQRLCGECGARLALVCPACQAANPPTNKFCGECGTKLEASTSAPVAPVRTPAAPSASPDERFGSPESYTPRHLAEKILTSRASLEGERKQVTVMFIDVSGFTAVSESLDPEEIHAIMNSAFEAIHGDEGTINQFLGDGVRPGSRKGRWRKKHVMFAVARLRAGSTGPGIEF